MWTVLIAVIIVPLIATIIFSGVIRTSTSDSRKGSRRDLVDMENTPSLPILFRMSFHFSAMIVMLGMKVDLCAWNGAPSYALFRFEMN